MRSVSQALNLFTNAVGSWLTIPLTLLVNSDKSNEWISDNIDDGHLDWYFFLLATIMFVCYIAYCQLCLSFEYVNISDLEILNQQLCEQEEQENREQEEEKQTLIRTRTQSSNNGNGNHFQRKLSRTSHTSSGGNGSGNGSGNSTTYNTLTQSHGEDF